MAASSLAVIIPTRARGEMVWRTVDSVLDDGVDEVVIIDDNRPGEQTVTAARDDHDRRVRVLDTGGVGISKARQTGVEAATSDVLLLLDDDVVAGPGLAAGHLAHHRAEEGLVVQGYMPTVLPSSRHLDDLPAVLYAKGYDDYIERLEADPTSVLHRLWGGNVSLHLADALRIGMRGAIGFDRHEDQDFGLRCLKGGLHGRFDRQLFAQHHVTRTFDQMLQVAYAYGIAEERLALTHRHELAAGTDLSSPDDFRPAVAAIIKTASVPGLRHLTAAMARAGAASMRGERLQGLQLRFATVAYAMAHHRGRLEGAKPEHREEVERLLASTG